MLLCGCSAEDVQQLIQDSIDMNGPPAVAGDWFGAPEGHEDESRDKTNAYSNIRDYLLPEVDITTVGEDTLSNLPEYDFSGPDPQGGDSTSTLDSSLVASSDSLAQAEADNAAQRYDKKIYLAPLYIGETSTTVVPQNYKAYSVLMDKYGFEKYDIEAYKAAVIKANKPIGAERKAIWNASTFKGKTTTIGEKTYKEWVLAWNLCVKIGNKLKADGCDVIYPYDNIATVKNDSNRSMILGSKASMSLEDIAEDIAKVKPDYVIYIGFNEAAFGATADGAKDTHTLFAYEEFTLKSSKGTKNEKFCIDLQRNWSNFTELSTVLPASKPIKTKKGEDITKYPGVSKAQTAITALRINDVNAKSCVLMLGDFNTNMSTKKTAYNYAHIKKLGRAIAVVIEQSLG